MKEWPARIVLVGAGKMGGAMAAGWLEGGLEASSLTIVEPNPSQEIEALAARGVAINPADPAPPDVLVLAVKPQSLDAVAPQIAPLADERTLVLSILAGKTIANLKARLPRARRGRPRHAQYARRDRPRRHRRLRQPRSDRRAAPLVRVPARRGRSLLLARGRGRDRRGDGDIGRRTRLCVRADGSARGGGGKARSAAGARDESRARNGRGRGRADAARKRERRPPSCAATSLRRAARRRRRSRCSRARAASTI